MNFGWLRRKLGVPEPKYDEPLPLEIATARVAEGFAMVLTAGENEVAVLLPRAQALELADQILTAFTEGSPQ